MEMSVELVVFLGIGLLLSSLLFGLLYRWDVSHDAKVLENAFEDREAFHYEKVDIDDFAIKAYSFFENCSIWGGSGRYGSIAGRGKNFTMSLYVYNSSELEIGSLTKEDLFNIYKELSWCNTIQSFENGCGEREDVIMETIDFPKVVVLECNSTNLRII